ncbi:MAG: c-type cytochrome [Gemmatimonadota bacterium]
MTPLLLVAGVLLSAAPAVGSRRPPDAVRGLALLQHFNDSLPQFAGNGLRCTSCHLDDGRRGTALPWLGVTARYPRYRSRRGALERIQQRVNDCIARSLAGRELAEDDPAMQDIVAYLDGLRRDVVPARPDSVLLAGDTLRGARQYVQQCARCHAADGGGGVAPAVTGAASYSVGAGMARQYALATFLRWNMPYDLAGTLPAQDAADIAAWLLRRPRPDHPGKERDWPNGDPPADVAYATDAARARGLAPPAPRPLTHRRVLPTPPLR